RRGARRRPSRRRRAGRGGAPSRYGRAQPLPDARVRPAGVLRAGGSLRPARRAVAPVRDHGGPAGGRTRCDAARAPRSPGDVAPEGTARMTPPTLGSVDCDEALTEAVATLCGWTRAELLRGAALGGAAMVAALAAPTEAAAARLDDTAILNFGLRFERLQSA